MLSFSRDFNVSSFLQQESRVDPDSQHTPALHLSTDMRECLNVIHDFYDMECG
jgi:hypothetical protein